MSSSDTGGLATREIHHTGKMEEEEGSHGETEDGGTGRNATPPPLLLSMCAKIRRVYRALGDAGGTGHLLHHHHLPQQY
ncbi:hypothetical protein Pmani_014169 [Petrolisthes manimaculis]|uniref:Uncharacterized protein n=1 Tax=Petrolisthes manimaculis TaxID=1843537 RepID=A0AAE1PU46_9EUCA|nr:hypothetical protein Pmani_014169 [Petrolisthes manimaculis]